MKLFEHPDFEQAIIQATAFFQSTGMREAIIEKDYYVTEALRVIQHLYGDKVIFKGGTSLSKGWNIIRRFSEDIDIFLNPEAFKPQLGKNAINRELKNLQQKIAAYPGLNFLNVESKTIGGFGRSDYFAYSQKFSNYGDIRNGVLVEVGTASGKEPTQDVQIQSFVGQFLQKTGITLGVDDEGSFTMKLLHFRRTFVEKMFAIHSKVDAFKSSGQRIGSYARHYYDLYCLSELPEVIQMLQSNEYEAIKSDYDTVSKKFFPKHYTPPLKMSFSESDALFPSTKLEKTLSTEYEAQCRILCFGAYPNWQQVQQRFNELRHLL